MKTDARIDAYIEKSQDFAKPILKHVRALVHKVCPGAEETMKWGMPHFDYQGEMMFGMAAFKQHCSFGFWKAAIMKDKTLIANAKSEAAMGHLGRVTSLNDLPSDKKLTAYLKEAMLLNEKGIKVKKEKAKPKDALEMPDDFQKALSKNKKAATCFKDFSPSAQRDYIEWVTEAKTEATRTKRLNMAVEWIAEGKRRNWKYEK